MSGASPVPCPPHLTQPREEEESGMSVGMAAAGMIGCGYTPHLLPSLWALRGAEPPASGRPTRGEA